MTPEGSGHLQPTAGVLQPAAAASQQLQNFTGTFQPVSCHIQPAAGQLLQHQQPAGQFQLAAAGQLQPALTQFPFISAVPSSSSAGGGGPTTYVYQLVGPPQSFVGGGQPVTPAGGAAQYCSLFGYPQQPVFPTAYGSLSGSPSVGTAGALVAGAPQIKTENGTIQIAFNTTTNQIQAFPLQQQQQQQLLSFHPQLQQQLQFQPVAVNSQQLLCSPPFLPSTANHLQPAVAPLPALRKKKAAKAPVKKKATTSAHQPKESGEAAMKEQQKLSSPLPPLSDHLREGLDLIFVVAAGRFCCVSATAQPAVTHTTTLNHTCDNKLCGESLIWQALQAADLVDSPAKDRGGDSEVLLRNHGPQLMESGIGLISVGAASHSGGQGIPVFAAEVVTDLRLKLIHYRPRIVVFYGKALFEVITNSTDWRGWPSGNNSLPPDAASADGKSRGVATMAYYGRQPELLHGGVTSDIVQWVVPAPNDGCFPPDLVTSSSSRGDKLVPCYRALRKYRDYLRKGGCSGGGLRPADAEMTFSPASLAARGRRVRREEFIVRKEEEEDKRKTAAQPPPREESPSTSVQSVHQQGTTQLQLDPVLTSSKGEGGDSDADEAGCESSSSDDLEMPVLKAEVPWPPPPAPKTDTQKSGAVLSSISSKRKTGAILYPHSPSQTLADGGHRHPPSPPQSPAVASKAAAASAALCDKNYESNEKPKTSEKCYYSTPLSTSDDFCETVSRRQAAAAPPPLPPPPSSNRTTIPCEKNIWGPTTKAVIMPAGKSCNYGKSGRPPLPGSRHRPASLSDSDSDSDLDLMPGTEKGRRKVQNHQQRQDEAAAAAGGTQAPEDPEQAFDRLVHSGVKGAAVSPLIHQRAGSPAPKAAVAALTSKQSPPLCGVPDDSCDDFPPPPPPVLSATTPPTDDQAAKERMMGPHQQQQQRSPVKFEGSTSIWGKQIASFDLSDDYVNDYLREQQAKKITENVAEDDPSFLSSSSSSSSSALVTHLLGMPTSTVLKRTPSPPARRPPAAAAATKDVTSSPAAAAGPQQQQPLLQAKKVSSRAASFDIIPACMPDSIGTEIDDIIQSSGFITSMGGGNNSSHDSEASQDAVSLSSMTSSMSSSGRAALDNSRTPAGGRKSKRRSGRFVADTGGGGGSGSASRRIGGKKARQKSTDNLHPNLLPEDYLDEVIGQYFNQDDEDSSDDEEAAAVKAAAVEKHRPGGKEGGPKAKVAAASNSRLPAKPPEEEGEDESSSEVEDRPGQVVSPPPAAKARIRPPASFFSMDFLEDPGDMLEEWQQEEEEEEEAPPPPARAKVKTELEIEMEYKHILYGGKKRKGPKIGVGKKKKTKKSGGGSKESSVEGKPIQNRLEPPPEGKAASSKGGKIRPKGRKLKKGLKAALDRSKLSVDQKNQKTRRPRSPAAKTGLSLVARRRGKVPPPTPPTPPPPPTSPSPARTRTGGKRAAQAACTSPLLTLPPPSPVRPPSSHGPKITGKGREMALASPEPPPRGQQAPQQSWKGKVASKKAYDRSAMRQNVKMPFTSSKIEDVTGKYGKEEELVTCGICQLLDPPVDPKYPVPSTETTEWVGCDCYRWFHKSCTKLMKFTEKFSCKSVRMRCLEARPVPVKPAPVTCKVKFAPDIPRFLIRDVKTDGQKENSSSKERKHLGERVT